MKRKFIMTFLIVYLFLVYTNKIYALDNVDVQIKPISEQKVFNKDFESEIEIIFNNKNLYNDQVYLSYHIFDQNNDKALVNENQRIPLKVDDNGITRVTLSIALSEINEIKKINRLYVRYDLVDEKNQYWFSTNEKVNFESFETIYTHNPWKRVTQFLKFEILKNPIIFSINILCCIGAIYAYYVIKKKKLL